MKSLKKTRAILLTAVFLISFMTVFVAAEFPFTTSLGVKNSATSTWTTSKAYTGFYSVHLQTTGTVGSGDEARFVVTLPSGITLGDLDTISWKIYTVAGYPAHVDITLDTTDPLQSMLTAELACNVAGYTPPPTGYTYNAWYDTWEGFTVDSNAPTEIDDTTLLWVTKMGAGNLDAPSSILGNWKTGTIDTDPHTELPTTEIDSDTPVLKLEIEVDNWIVQTEAYLDDVKINGLDIMGISGPQGIQGPAGSEGPQGPKGSQGSKGSSGSKGATGPRGHPGPSGTDGKDGPQGSEGTQGPLGEQGKQGLQGERGPQGEQGKTGSLGETGSKGSPGDPAPAVPTYGAAGLSVVAAVIAVMAFKKP